MVEFRRTALVTGGAGAIGSVLVDQLSQDSSCRVVVLDNLSSGRRENLPSRKNVRFIQGSVDSDEDLELAFDGPLDAVFHLAANFANQNSVDFPMKDLSVQGVGTLKLLLKSTERRVGRFIYVSSSCVYGSSNEPMDEKSTTFDPITPYGITKLLGERYVGFFGRHHRLKTVILRYFNVYGPNEYPGKYRNVIPNFFHRAMRNEDITITGTGDETRDFNFVEDTVRATILASQNDKAVGRIFNIASGRETKIKDLVKLIVEIARSRSKVVYGERRDWDTTGRRVAVVGEAKTVLDYQPKIGLREGLARYHDWLQKHALDPRPS